MRTNFKNSLYWRISATFLMILLLLGLAYVLITTLASTRYYQETTQRLNAHVAEHLLQEVSPFVDGKVNEESLGKIMHSMMAVNPSIEVYLLDPDGEILSFVVLDKKVKLSRVNVEPIRQFIVEKGEQYILGDDPRNPGKSIVFSATPVLDNAQLLGYVYIVLDSEQFDNVTSALTGSYWMKVGARAFVLSLLAAFLLGLGFIWIITKNIRVIVQAFQRFEEGDLTARIPEENMNGELKILSTTFNNMADKILQNIDDLKQVDVLRRELIANVSHDLRSPLAVIHGYIETLSIKNETLTPEKRQQYLQVILKGSEKLNKMVQELFELSKLDAQQLELQRESFYVNDLLSDTVRQYELSAAEKNIRITAHIADAIPMIHADLSLMERVIQNLISNAIQYTPENGKVEIAAVKQEKQLTISVRNSGEGIASEDLPHLFDRYFKVSRHNSDSTGLGLAIVKKILDLHQFSIQVFSEPGKLTEFAVQIPLKS